MAQWFLMIDIWILRNLDGYQLWLLFKEINLQGRGKLFFQSISPNDFGEVPHTIGCKTPLGIVG